MSQRMDDKTAVIRHTEARAISSSNPLVSLRVEIEKDAASEIIMRIRAEDPEPSTAPPQRRQTPYHEDDDGMSATMSKDTDSEPSPRTSLLSGDLCLAESPYAKFLSKVQDEMGISFPEAMVTRLNISHHGHLAQVRVKETLSDFLISPRSHSSYIVRHIEYSDWARDHQSREDIGITRSRALANTIAMAYFCEHYEAHLCWPRDVDPDDEPSNSWGIPFTEGRSHTSLDPYDDKTWTVGYSAWNVDEMGCLTLSASYGESLSMVVVEAKPLYTLQ
ncbi:hypothetical protein AAE478_009346 [Parahypoxylon ruwenzoriense]